jgi:hypothetical protein
LEDYVALEVYTGWHETVVWSIIMVQRELLYM